MPPTVSQMMATKYTHDDRTQPVLRTMPLCRFPTQARYSGHGDVNSAANWSCPANQELLQVGPNGASAGLVGPVRRGGWNRRHARRRDR
jgi:hypothetical protein